MDYIVYTNSLMPEKKSLTRIAEKFGLEAFKLNNKDDSWMTNKKNLMFFEHLQKNLLFSEHSKIENTSENTKKLKKSDEKKQEKTKRKSIPRAVRDRVWNEAFGEKSGVGMCSCCCRELTQQSFECGHVIAQARGGEDTPANMRPLCRACNRSMSTRDMDEFRKTHFGLRTEDDVEMIV
jgi:5-methylcytosine-specific restriction endonuclease McrA